ncbi:MAG TPA: ATP-binding cassette domain-containing protein [Solirubrobacteraceae bacterium]|nr:ATP-binding cassette domain-containing protein [Solirubrobacteraceae bacterium]
MTFKRFYRDPASEGDMEATIQASDLHKAYPPGIRAVDGVSLSVPAGTIIALLGPNGAGKSTTVRLLSTLSRPDKGTAHICGVDVVVDPVRVRHLIGVVGQKHGIDPEATGRENLVLQAEFYRITGREGRRRVADTLERVGLASSADRLAKTYSGGMQRRLDIALALLHRPRVLFLDEPTTGLDPEARMELWAEIERLAAVHNMTILLTTHYMEEADRLAGEVAIIDSGRVVARGTPHQLKSELEGDSIQIQLSPGAGAAARDALGRVPGLAGVAVDGDLLRAAARDGAAAIPAALAALDAAGAGVTSVTLARPSLDDVYLRHAGRAFDHAPVSEAVPA